MSLPSTQKTLEPPQGATLAPASSAVAPRVSAREEMRLEELLGGILATEAGEDGPATSRDGGSITEVPPRMLVPGGRVGRYLIEDVLGRGGMGLVLRAHDELLQRDVAVKVILPEYSSSDPTAGLRFLREAEIVAKLRHPHIVGVLDAGLDSGVAYLALDYVPGPTYSDLRSKGGLPVRRAVDLLLPIVSAVGYANSLGIVHGDIKPTNLLLANDYRNEPHPYILDFGVSFFSQLDAGLDPTRGKITGTPGYIAPEWWEKGDLDGRADCFSLGCVLYELIAGFGPYSEARRLSEARAMAVARAYRTLSELSACEKNFDGLVECVLSPDPSCRFESVKAFGAALLPYASEELRGRYASEFK